MNLILDRRLRGADGAQDDPGPDGTPRGRHLGIVLLDVVLLNVGSPGGGITGDGLAAVQTEFGLVGQLASAVGTEHNLTGFL